MIDWMTRFPVSSSLASDASALAGAGGKALPEAVPLGYAAAFFLGRAPQRGRLTADGTRQGN